MEGSLEDAIRAISEDVLARAQAAAPRDEGTLAGTGTAEVEVHGEKVVGKVSFSTPYAKRQHEELTWEHPKGGKAKYLEGPLTDQSSRYQKIIGDTVKRGLKNGRS